MMWMWKLSALMILALSVNGMAESIPQGPAGTHAETAPFALSAQQSPQVAPPQKSNQERLNEFYEQCRPQRGSRSNSDSQSSPLALTGR